MKTPVRTALATRGIAYLVRTWMFPFFIPKLIAAGEKQKLGLMLTKV